MEDGEALEAAKQAMEEMEKELQEHGSYRTCKNMGAQQAQYLKALDFVSKWSDNINLYHVRRCRAGWDADKNCACSRGLASPNKL
eukprot:7168658-Pyramimonas_sp.AAC.2